MIGNEVPFSKNGIERKSLVPGIQPVRKIFAVSKINASFDRERRELMYTYVRNRRRKLTKRKNPEFKKIEQPTGDILTNEKIEQDFMDYKSELKNRLSFDRAQIFHEELS